MKDTLTESLEKYLLAIYEIVKVNKAARVKDVSNYLKIGGPATSDAVKTLAARKYINYVPYGIITITPKGERKAKEKIKRHTTISNFLEKVLMIPKEEVDNAAKHIEYSMTDDILDKFIKFLAFMEACSCKESKWIKSYKHYNSTGEMQDKCKQCLENNSGNSDKKCGCDCC